MLSLSIYLQIDLEHLSILNLTINSDQILVAAPIPIINMEAIIGKVEETMTFE